MARSNRSDEAPPSSAFITIDGRRWRASDPRIPERLRQALVDELMAARRAVKHASGTQPDLRLARQRVQDAKVALGERGHPWWLKPEDVATAQRIDAAARALGAGGRTVSASDIARVVGGTTWRSLLPLVRERLGLSPVPGDDGVTSDE
jgi:hypothetical protein